MVLGMAVLGRIEPMTLATAYAIAGVGAVGTMAMAWLMQRRSDYPRWAWWATGGVMAAALLISVSVTGDPAVWAEQVRSSAWMLPWSLWIMGLSRTRARGICAPAHPRAGWILLGTGMLLSVILLGAHAIVGAFLRLFAG
jgi:hypothetical protein